MKKSLAVLLGLALIGAGAPAALAQGGDFTGTWDIDAQYTTGGSDDIGNAATVDCLYSGTAMITGDSGPVSLTLTGSDPAGPKYEDLCEPSLSGTATVRQSSTSDISGDISDPTLGTASFSGTIAAAQPAFTAAAAQQINGTVTATSGPLSMGASSGGIFAANLMPAVPSLPPAAFGLLLFLLVAGGGYFIVRRREHRSL